jgi:membrane protease YdiL (CAAX protease family)
MEVAVETRMLLGFVAVYALFQWSAVSLGSERGQAGVLVAALVVGATLAVERAWSGQSVWCAVRAIGLGRPSLQGLVVSVAVCGLLLLTVPVHARWTGSTVTLTDGALWLLPGLFAQAGIAEETLFRGHLFGHLRVRRSFWRRWLRPCLPSSCRFPSPVSAS